MRATTDNYATTMRRQLLLTETNPGRARCHVENDVLALEEDITKDGEPNAAVRLNATEARNAGVVGRGVVHVRARDCRIVSAKEHSQPLNENLLVRTWPATVMEKSGSVLPQGKM